MVLLEHIAGAEDIDPMLNAFLEVLKIQVLTFLYFVELSPTCVYEYGGLLYYNMSSWNLMHLE